jgi:hypothetical protein
MDEHMDLLKARSQRGPVVVSIATGPTQRTYVHNNLKIKSSLNR